MTNEVENGTTPHQLSPSEAVQDHLEADLNQLVDGRPEGHGRAVGHVEVDRILLHLRRQHARHASLRQTGSLGVS